MSNNISTERKLKIQPKYSPRRFNEAKFPEIRLTGKWLEELGFTCGKLVKVIIENGKLVIDLIPEPKSELQVIKKAGRRGTAKVISLNAPGETTTLRA